MEIVKAHNHQQDFGGVKAKKLLARAKKRLLEEPNVLPAVVSRETFSNADAKPTFIEWDLASMQSDISETARSLRMNQYSSLVTSLVVSTFGMHNFLR